MPENHRALGTPGEVADYLKIPVKTLAEWRSKGTGPRYHKVGVHVRYDWNDVRAWLARRVPSGRTA
jgi:excisionase family DNA binding protein